MFNLFEFGQNNKPEHPICCPHCTTTLIARNVTYLRAHPEKTGPPYSAIFVSHPNVRGRPFPFCLIPSCLLSAIFI